MCGRMKRSGRGAAWLARLLGVQEVPSSNLGGPTKRFKRLQPSTFFTLLAWRPTGVQIGRQRVRHLPGLAMGLLGH